MKYEYENHPLCQVQASHFVRAFHTSFVVKSLKWSFCWWIARVCTKSRWWWVKETIRKTICLNKYWNWMALVCRKCSTVFWTERKWMGGENWEIIIILKTGVLEKIAWKCVCKWELWMHTYYYRKENNDILHKDH